MDINTLQYSFMFTMNYQTTSISRSRPPNPLVHHWYGGFNSIVGRPQRAKAEDGQTLWYVTYGFYKLVYCGFNIGNIIHQYGNNHGFYVDVQSVTVPMGFMLMFNVDFPMGMLRFK